MARKTSRSGTLLAQGTRLAYADRTRQFQDEGEQRLFNPIPGRHPCHSSDIGYRRGVHQVAHKNSTTPARIKRTDNHRSPNFPQRARSYHRASPHLKSLTGKTLMSMGNNAIAQNRMARLMAPVW